MYKADTDFYADILVFYCRDEDLADLLSVRETMQSLLLDDCMYNNFCIYIFT